MRFALRGKISLRLQYALWLIVLVRLLFPLELGTSFFSLTAAVEQLPVVQDIESIRGFDDIVFYDNGTVTGYHALPDDYQELISYHKTSEQYARLKILFTLCNIIEPVWKSGVLIFLLFCLWNNLKFSNNIKKTRKWLPAHGELPVYISDKIDTPCLLGFYRPVIYVTPQAASVTEVLHNSIEHELTHYRHKDHLWAILRCAVAALHWYNPLVWLAVKLSRDDAELACDEATLLRLGEDQRASYGRTLIEMACQGPSSLITTATTMTGSPSTLKERIQFIANKPKMAVYTLISVLLIAAFAAVFTFTGPPAEKSAPEKLAAWLDGITSEHIASVKAYIGDSFGQDNTLLSVEELETLVSCLNSIEESDISTSEYIGFDNGPNLYLSFNGKVGSMESCLFRCMYDGENIALSFDEDVSKALTNGQGTVWVNSPELGAFIAQLNEFDISADEY